MERLELPLAQPQAKVVFIEIGQRDLDHGVHPGFIYSNIQCWT